MSGTSVDDRRRTHRQPDASYRHGNSNWSEHYRFYADRILSLVIWLTLRSGQTTINYDQVQALLTDAHFTVPSNELLSSVTISYTIDNTVESLTAATLSGNPQVVSTFYITNLDTVGSSSTTLPMQPLSTAPYLVSYSHAPPFNQIGQTLFSLNSPINLPGDGSPVNLVGDTRAGDAWGTPVTVADGPTYGRCYSRQSERLQWNRFR